MPKELSFHPLVADDIVQAIEWYEGRSAGLGERFRSAVDRQFDIIADTPEMFPRAFDDLDIRFARVRKFPYLVLFRLHSHGVFMIGVLHSASDPAKWRLRADGP